MGTASRLGSTQLRNNALVSDRDKICLFSSVHLASFSVSTGGSLCRIKQPGPEAAHLVSCNIKFNNEWHYSFTPPNVCMVCTATLQIV